MLATILPMLEEMRNVMKMVQQRYMYIAKYNTVRKMTCVALDNLYRTSDSFSVDEKLSGWMRITDLDNPDKFLKIDAKGELCANIRGVEIPMYYYGRPMSMRKGKKPRKPKLIVTKEVFEQIVESVINSVKDISSNLSSKIRERLPRHKLLESMCIVFLHY